MKYLLVLAVVMVAFYVWRNNRVTDRSQSRPPPPPGTPRLPVVMVACQHCGTHLPQGDTVQGALGPYCSADHRRLKEGSST
ncbi:MAG: PP0621 family protein [Hydrogenophaga sp.]